MERLDCAVIGAGVIGLACARALAQAGRDVVILEAADAIGTHTSARNSEVIHAGIYYPPGSEKARHCVRGKQMLYEFCASHGVATRNSGKLIVAVGEDQHPELEKIADRARRAGVTDLEWLDEKAAHGKEPEVSCTAALFSPSTGLVDSHGYMLAMQGDAEEAGAMLALNSPVEGGRVTEDGIVLEVGGAEPMTILARTVVNAAGLWAQPVSRSIEGIPSGTIPGIHYARGVYFSLSGKQPFSRPVYPIPEPGGLGCHYTIDLGGQGKFGPDVEWIDAIDYTVNPERGELFYEAIRRYWPALPDGALHPSYAGVRPKLFPAGGDFTDFTVQGPGTHGVPGLVALYGIESPGLTSALSVAEDVRDAAQAATPA